MRALGFALAISFGLGVTGAAAQEEIPPPQGKGRVVVVASGASGASHYEQVAHEIAKLGYDVVLYDSNTLAGTHGEALKVAITQVQTMPNALPGKVGVVGFSLGGGIALGYASHWDDQVAVDVVWYPATTEIQHVDALVGHMSVPVLMFAGESDTFRNCCTIDKAHEIATAAQAANAPYQLVTYPDTDHDFVIGGNHYNPTSYSDAFQHTAAMLAKYLK